MSNFNEIARNPATGIVEMAYWIDNHFGPHRYGVRFLDGTVWRPEEVDIRIGDRVVRDGEEAKKPVNIRLTASPNSGMSEMLSLAQLRVDRYSWHNPPNKGGKNAKRTQTKGNADRVVGIANEFENTRRLPDAADYQGLEMAMA